MDTSVGRRHFQAGVAPMANAKSKPELRAVQHLESSCEDNKRKKFIDGIEAEAEV